MYQVFLVLFIIVIFTLIALIMLQKNTGSGGMGINFNIGISSSLFSSSGAVTFINRLIITLITLFFIFSLILNNFDSKKENKLHNLNKSKYKEETAEVSQLSNQKISDIPK